MTFKSTEMQMIIGNAKILFTTEIKSGRIICGYFHFYKKMHFLDVIQLFHDLSNLDKKKKEIRRKEKCPTSDSKKAK